MGKNERLESLDYFQTNKYNVQNLDLVISLKSVCVGPYGLADGELTTEPPRMQPGLGPSVHMELKNLLRHRQGGQASNSGACEDLLSRLKLGLRHL